MTRSPSSAKRHSGNRPAQKRREKDGDGPVWLYGRHAVAAALRNPARKVHRLLVTRNARDWLSAAGLTVEEDAVRPPVIDAALHAGAVHQGIAIEVDDLPRARLKEVCRADRAGPVVVLDQVTDPQNIGAVFRVAAAFGAQAVVAQDRRTPPISGALAKAAVGTVELVPFISVVNIARSLEALADLGFTTVGLTGEGSIPIGEVGGGGPGALVLGAEGKGVREGVAAQCMHLAHIPIDPRVESLNVASAASIALYAVTRQDHSAAS